jgi:hypothetical protein
MLVQQLVAKPSVEALEAAVLHRAAWLDEVQIDIGLCSPAGHCITRELRAVVELMIFGNGRFSMGRLRTRMTRSPVSEKSTSIAIHSRVKSSMIVSSRNLRPLLRASWTKSNDHRSPANVAGFTALPRT